MRILLAEDDTRLAEPLAEFLEREQHAVTWVSDGRKTVHGQGYRLLPPP